MFKKSQSEEKKEAAFAAAEAEEAPVKEREKKDRSGFFDKLFGVAETARGVKNTFDEVYSTWIKPVHTNWPHVKRRLSLVSTVISLIFFIIYVPLVFFSKISQGLGMGWGIALYVCSGAYAFMLIAMLITLVATGRASSTKKSRTRRRIYSLVKLIVRILALALSITVLVISAQADQSPIKTLAMVVAIVSIIFSVLPLLFGGAAGFFKWLISPVPENVKRDFSFVALEWKQMLTESDLRTDKAIKKGMKRHGDRVADCLDKYLLPALGKKKIRSVEGQTILDALASVPEDDLNLTEWEIKQIFTYAEGAGYVEENPCTPLNLSGDISKEKKR